MRESHSDSAAVLIVCVVSGAFTVTSIVRVGAFLPTLKSIHPKDRRFVERFGCYVNGMPYAFLVLI